MIRISLVTVSFLAFCGTAYSAEPIEVREKPINKSQVELAKLVSFPEDYIGKQLCLEDARVKLEMKRDKDMGVFFIEIRYGDRVLKPITDLEFAISEKMARQVLDSKEKFDVRAEHYVAKVQFEIIEKKTSLGKKTIAQVTIIDAYVGAPVDKKVGARIQD